MSLHSVYPEQAKYGIKLWLAADPETNCVIMASPYVGQVDRPAERSVGAQIVLELLKTTSEVETLRLIISSRLFL